MQEDISALSVIQREIRILVRLFARDRRKQLPVKELARAFEARSRLLAFVMPDARADIREEIRQCDELLLSRHKRYKLPTLSKAILRAAVGKLRGLSDLEEAARRKACLDVETLCKNIENLSLFSCASRPTLAERSETMH